MEGIEQIQRGLAENRASEHQVGEPHRLTLLAEACAKAGDSERALQLVQEALATMDKRDERIWEAEARRLKGEVLKRSHVDDAWACFHEALDIARNQFAKSFELRTTISFTRLLAEQGKRNEARAMLADVYNWFTEGFDTADLKDAKALLDELSA
jgi:predicted ATPase